MHYNTLTAFSMYCVSIYISDYEMFALSIALFWQYKNVWVPVKFMFTVDEKSLKEYICWNLHSVLENICLTTECGHILTFKRPHWESIKVLQQFSFGAIMLGFDIQKIGYFFLNYFMINAQSQHKKIKAVWQLIDTLLAVKDVGNCIKAWKALGNFAVPSLNTIVKTSVFHSPFFWNMAFSSCPFKYFYLLYLCFLMYWLILPG